MVWLTFKKWKILPYEKRKADIKKKNVSINLEILTFQPWLSKKGVISMAISWCGWAGKMTTVYVILLMSLLTDCVSCLTMTKELRKIALDAHNKYRKKEDAANMRWMVRKFCVYNYLHVYIIKWNFLCLFVCICTQIYREIPHVQR